MKNYYQENKEKYLARQKLYYQRNREKRLAYQKLYNQKNKDKILEIHKEYRDKNKEKIREYYRDWYEKNGRNRAENYVEGILEWANEHPERVKASRKLREAVNRGEIKKPEECENCHRTGIKLHAHHIDYNDFKNVKWLCASCHKLEHNKARHSG